jgi:hypothetical protein
MRLLMRQYNKKRDVNKNANVLMKRGDWWRLSIYQKLSENFIEKYEDKMCWINISMCQKLSENFIEKYKNKASWYWIFQYQKLSPKFKEKWKHKCGW